MKHSYILNFDSIFSLCNHPQLVKREFITVLLDNQDEFSIRGMDHPLILVHFLAQVMEETDSFYDIDEMHAKPGDYNGRMGNGDEGYKYRGRGLLQLTGRDNYKWIGDYIGVDLIESPELLEEPYWALVSALEYWDLKRLNKYALQDNLLRITCLLYTSDAADERSSVDLGGR